MCFVPIRFTYIYVYVQCIKIYIRYHYELENVVCSPSLTKYDSKTRQRLLNHNIKCMAWQS